MKRNIQKAIMAIVFAWVGWAANAAAPREYQNHWQSPALQKRVSENIEKHRKGDMAFEVVDASGKGIQGARLNVQQTGHEFLFGCNAFVLGQMKEMEAQYEKAFVHLFNFATVPFYWEGTEPQKGELRYTEGPRDIWRRPSPERFLAFASQYGVTLKGHPLLWHAYNPTWLPKDPGELRELYQKRFREISSRFGDKIPIWDVVNESLVCNTNYPLYTKERSYVRWAFKEALPMFSNSNVMMINEVTSFNFIAADKNPYLQQIKQLLADGIDVRGIGLQYHFFRREALDKYLNSSNSHPGKLLDLYEAMADFKLPLYITEITFPSAGPDGAALQAEVVRDHYRLWFSAPTMAGITWWNLGDGTAVKGENEAMGGLMDVNLKPKDAYGALDKLINEEWKTQQSIQTDSKGAARLRGFYGKYEVTVLLDGKMQKFQVSHLNKNQSVHRLVWNP